MAHDGAVLADPLHVSDRRNHHLNGMPGITEARQGFPGRHGRMPDECATIGQVLQDDGFSTFWLGKNHNVPEQDSRLGREPQAVAAAKGFDRYYGFLGGETNQWYPDLIEDNRFIDQPYGPEEGYHLSKDLADQAIGMIRDQKAAIRRSRGSCGSARAPIMLRTMPEGIHRQVQGQVRRRLRGLPRMGASPHDREGHSAEGNPAHADQSHARRTSRTRAMRCAPGTRLTPTRRSCSPA